MQRTLRKIMVALLALASLFSILQYWSSTIGLDRGRDALSDWETRIAPAREVIPIKRGLVGYVGESDVSGIDFAFWDQEGEYMLAQYALAPLILKKGPAAEWNVAVLSPKALAAWQAQHESEFKVISVGHSI